MCVYTRTLLHRDCICITVATNNTASEAVLRKPGVVRSVDKICIIRVPAWRWLGEYVTLDSTFYSILFKQEVATVPSYFHIFFLIAFLEEALIGNIIILWIHYTIIIVICLNNKQYNNNNNNGELKNLVLLFKIPMGTHSQKRLSALTLSVLITSRDLIGRTLSVRL